MGLGREIRRVPPDWEHPRYTNEDAERPNQVGMYKPLYDEDYDTAARRWLKGLLAWEKDTRGVRTKAKAKGEFYERYWWDWNWMPPDRASYRPAFKRGSATAYQMYETVSEGTPVTPVFATQAELVDYLCAHGDEWDQQRGAGGWRREAAEAFVKAGAKS